MGWGSTAGSLESRPPHSGHQVIDDGAHPVDTDVCSLPLLLSLDEGADKSGPDDDTVSEGTNLSCLVTVGDAQTDTNGDLGIDGLDASHQFEEVWARVPVTPMTEVA